MELFLNWLTETLPGTALMGIRFEATRFALGTLGTFFAVWIILEPLLRSRKIRRPTPRKKQIKMELINSLRTVCIFVALDILIFDLAEFGIFRKFDPNSDYGAAWFWVSIPLLIVLHDAYFYWVHRAMHHAKIYKSMHLTHHRSHNPTPFTAYSFAPGEAVVMYGFVPLVLMIVPLMPGVLPIVMFIMIFKNATGHCGYELFPRGMTRNPVLRQFTTVTHHDMHHEKAGGNYGFYFTWWDRWMGTEHANYEARFEAVTEKRDQEKAEGLLPDTV